MFFQRAQIFATHSAQTDFWIARSVEVSCHSSLHTGQSWQPMFAPQVRGSCASAPQQHHTRSLHGTTIVASIVVEASPRAPSALAATDSEGLERDHVHVICHVLNTC